MSILSKNYRFRRLALQQRSGTYYVRVVVPESLRSFIGKTELKESLRTNDLKSAQQLAPKVEEKFKAIIQAAREGKPLGLEKQKVDNLNLVTGSFYRHLLKKFDESYIPRYFDAQDIREEFGLPGSTNGVGPKGESGTEMIEERFYEIAKEEVDRQGKSLEMTELSRLAYRLENAFERAINTLEARAQGLQDPEDPYPKGEETDLDLLQAFDHWVGDQQNLKTKDTFQSTAKEWISETGLSSLRRITRKDVKEWIRQKSNQGLKPRTINNKIVHLQSIANSAKNDGLIENWDNPFNNQNLTIKRSKATDRRPFTSIEVKQIVCNCLEEGKRPADKWIPLLMISTGVRNEEAASLLGGDFKKDQNGKLYLQINDINKAAPKTESSLRDVPIPNCLLKLGLEEFVRETALGERVFKDLREDKYGKVSSKWSEKWSKTVLRGELHIEDLTAVLYSARHYHADVLRDHFGRIPGLDQTIMDAIRGHRSQEVSNTYGKGFRIEKLNEIVSSIDFLLIDK